MPKLFFVPGFGGTELDLVKRNPSGTVRSRRNLWGGFGQLASADAWEALALPNPDPDLGQVEPSRVAWQVESYGDFLRWLPRAFPETAKVQILPWPYDFRLHARDLGQLLAGDIKAAAGEQGSVWILAHSYGALVAHAAYAALVDSGQAGLIGRITTFGAILYGSHCAATAWAERDDGVGTLSMVGAAMSGQLNLLRPEAFAFGSLSFRRLLLEVFASWPANYCMLPDPSAADDPADTQRLSLLYDAGAWSRALAPPRQALMDDARVRLWGWIRAAKYVPPGSVMNHIVGRGQITPARVLPPRSATQAAPPFLGRRAAELGGARERRFFLPTWENTPDGDARATQAQQALPGLSREFVVGVHGSLHDNPGVRALIPILLQRSEVLPQPNPPTSALPPGEQFLVDGSWLRVTPRPAPVGGSKGAPTRIVQLDP
jgi:hypothetical protein